MDTLNHPIQAHNAISVTDELFAFLRFTQAQPFCVQLHKRLLQAVGLSGFVPKVQSQTNGYFYSYGYYDSYAKKTASTDDLASKLEPNNELDDKLSTIAHQLGYQKAQQDNAICRIKTTLQSPLLGFDKSCFDFKYAQAEFIAKLCALLLSNTPAKCKANQTLCALAINQLSAFYGFYAHAYQPFVFVDTQFKRINQPIYALALCELYRRINLPKTVQLLPQTEQITVLAKLIQTHYQQQQNQQDAVLGIWGDIHQYVYHFATFVSDHNQTNNQAQAHAQSQAIAKQMGKGKLIFDVQGKLINSPCSHTSRAMLHI